MLIYQLLLFKQIRIGYGESSDKRSSIINIQSIVLSIIFGIDISLTFTIFLQSIYIAKDHFLILGLFKEIPRIRVILILTGKLLIQY